MVLFALFILVGLVLAAFVGFTNPAVVVLIVIGLLGLATAILVS